jgi:hypothetical protein
MTSEKLAQFAWRLGLALATVSLVVWVVLQDLPPSGLLATRALPGDANPFIGILRPENRVALSTDGGTKVYSVIGDPVYFQLAMPKFFHQVTVTLEYRATATPEVELGPRTSNDAWGFDLKPLDAAGLDQSGWSVRIDRPYRIYERRPTNLSISYLLRQRAADHLALWHVDPMIFGVSDKDFVVWSWDTDLKRSPLETVVTAYTPPQDLGDGWKRASATFDRGEVPLQGDEAQFAISVPSAGRSTPPGTFEVRAIEARYERPAFSLASFGSGVIRQFGL